MTVTNVIDKLNKKHQVTEVDVIFSGLVNSSEADNIGTYRLATAGKNDSFTTKSAGIIKVKKAAYSPSTNTVAPTPRKPFALTKPVQVLIYGSGPTALQDAEGRDIDGDHNGTPGGNAIAIIAKKGVTVSACATASKADRRKSVTPSAVDLLFAHHGALADSGNTRHAQRAYATNVAENLDSATQASRPGACAMS